MTLNHDRIGNKLQAKIDYGQVYDIIQNDLDDLETFSKDVTKSL